MKNSLTSKSALTVTAMLPLLVNCSDATLDMPEMLDMSDETASAMQASSGERSGCLDEQIPDSHYPPGPIYPDCVDNPRPRMCTTLVNNLVAELFRFRQDLLVPSAAQLSLYYHRQAILHRNNVFYRGRMDIHDHVLVPIAEAFSSVDIDPSPFHFQAITPRQIISYGAISAHATFKDGSMFHQIDHHQTLTWVCSQETPNRPFVLISVHE